MSIFFEHFRQASIIGTTLRIWE